MCDLCQMADAGLRGRKERERDAILEAAFREIALSANTFSARPTKVLLGRIEQLCKECRETLEKNVCVMDLVKGLKWEKEKHYGGRLPNGEYGPMGIYSVDGEHVANVYTAKNRIAINGIGDEVLADEVLTETDWEEACRILIGVRG